MRSFAVIPAAGRSERMGTHKLLMPWRGATVIDHVLTAWRDAHVDRVVIVVRDDDHGLIDACQGHAAEVVRANPAPVDMRASVQWALRHIDRQWAPGPDDVWLLAPADMPTLTPGAIRRVAETAERYPGQVIRPVSGGQHGHPVAVPWSVAAAVLRLLEGTRVSAAWRDHPGVEVEIDHSCVIEDLDTPSDARRLARGDAASG